MRASQPAAVSRSQPSHESPARDGCICVSVIVSGACLQYNNEINTVPTPVTNQPPLRTLTFCPDFLNSNVHLYSSPGICVCVCVCDAVYVRMREHDAGSCHVTDSDHWHGRSCASTPVRPPTIPGLWLIRARGPRPLPCTLHMWTEGSFVRSFVSVRRSFNKKTSHNVRYV